MSATADSEPTAARPRIVVTTYEAVATWSYWRDVDAVLAPRGYVEGVRRAGGLPLLLPPVEEVAEQARELLREADGLVVVGGPDVTPARYGAAAHAEAFGWQRDRDAAELGLIEAALALDVPYLGVCRGMQLLNVLRGGSLHQHLPEVVPDAARHRPGLGRFSRHRVRIERASLLGELLGTRLEVVSSHHQALERIGTGLVATAWDELDGVVEGLEDPGRTFCVGVQWHPEEDLDAAGGDLFGSFVAHARRHRIDNANEVLEWQ